MLDREPLHDLRPTPFLKWAGGKGKLIPQLSRLMPRTFRGYLEPFVGGGALFYHVATEHRPERSVLIDRNADLIECYEVVRDDPASLIEVLEEHRVRHAEDPEGYYYHIRDDVDPASLGAVGRAARLIYLNKTCFNGLYRLNRQGRFNVPLGSYRRPAIYDAANILAASRCLQGVTLASGDFSRVLEFAGSGDFVYFDPPYYPISRTASFTSYTAETFLEDEQTRLRDTVEELSRRHCYVMVSNSYCEFILTLYDRPGLVTHVVEAPRSINCQGDKRGPVREVVVVNYEV